MGVEEGQDVLVEVPDQRSAVGVGRSDLADECRCTAQRVAEHAVHGDHLGDLGAIELLGHRSSLGTGLRHAAL
jgi:hypothetical protein